MHIVTVDYLQSLRSGLTTFDKVPNVVGLGALVLSIVLELTIRALMKRQSEDSTQDMLRHVFAEEKASGVRDSMEEYMKRLGMYLHQPKQALEETERLEKQLSDQLTHLKNSMLHDHHMSSRALKHWTNGAAFHLQMLIHAARLKIQIQLQVHEASIISVVDCYRIDLNVLLKQYKTYKKWTIFLYQPSAHSPWMDMVGYDWRIKDNELGKETHTVVYREDMLGSSDAYVDHMFDNWSVIKKLNSYFSDLRNNVKELIVQNVEFNMQNILPVSRIPSG